MRIKFTLAALAAALLTGCFSPTENIVREFDADGRLTRETITSESVIKTITASTQGKTVFAWDNSWLAYISATTSTVEDPTPTLKMGIGRADKGVLTLAPGHSLETTPELIRAARAGEISLSTSGVSTTSGTK